MSGPVEFFVELTELGRVRTELQTLVAELEQLDTRPAVDASAEAMGDGSVAAELEHFVATWRDGLAAIRDGLVGCMLLTELAMESYTATETGLQAAAEAS